MSLSNYLVGFIFVTSFAHAETSSTSTSSTSTPPTAPLDVAQYLRDFHRNPKAMMNRPLAHLNEQGQLDGPAAPFAAENMTRDEIFTTRDQVRAKICANAGRSCIGSGLNIFSEIDEHNRMSDFLFKTDYIKTLAEMEKQNLLAAAAPKIPWADSYWPQTHGITAWRYTDKAYDAKDFNTNYQAFVATPAVSIEQMSPSEKYDRLIGIGNQLTQTQWDVGLNTIKGGGVVPGWAGICHGWAPASIYTQNPQRAVTLTAYDGLPITFYPSDIKALVSLLWANASPPQHFVGTRCKSRHPKEDENGRVIDPNCLDVNPATFHMGLVNQLGGDHRSFIFDAEYDVEVWNFPIISYRYKYFNPQTLAVSNQLAGSMIPISEFSIDKFKKYRSPRARYAVGIVTDLKYVKEMAPSHSPAREGQFPKSVIRYVYDLELDADGEIIGGEWYSNFHPGFIWNLPPDARPISKGEVNHSTVWDGHSPLPMEFQGQAAISSPEGQPLSAVVETMLDLAAPAPQ